MNRSRRIVLVLAVFVGVAVVLALRAIMPPAAPPKHRLPPATTSLLSRMGPWSRDQIPLELRARRQDYRRFPRVGFGFVLETGNGFLVDTFSDSVTKDMVRGPDTTIALRLTEEELDAIYETMIAIRFFEFPEPHLPTERRGYLTPNDGVVRLTARAGGVTRTQSWFTGDVPTGARIDDWKRLYLLTELIWRIVESHAEYQELPPPRGLYM